MSDGATGKETSAQAPAQTLSSVDATKRALETRGYLCDEQTAVSTYLAQTLQRPLLVEGPAGVGKTELAHVVAAATGRPLFRLQCYEGLDESRALYEWNYGKQMLYAQLLRPLLEKAVAESKSVGDALKRFDDEGSDFFTDRFLLPRPLLQALLADGAVLLIDEIDKADPEFEAFLLEVLSDFAVSIPELGRVAAKQIPFCVLTSNRSRELSDPLRRRCLHLFLDYPDARRERAIVAARLPDVGDSLARQVVAAVQYIRTLDVRKMPSVGETLDWTRALVHLGADVLDAQTIDVTLGALVKHERDAALLKEKAGEVAARARRAAVDSSAT